MFRFIALAALSFTVIASTAVLAQDVAPEDVLPPVSALQGEWTLEAANVEPRDPLAMSQLTAGVYLGPQGSRATVLVAQVQEGPLAAQKTWRLMRRALDNTKTTVSVESDSRDLPLVSGCTEMERLTGVDRVIAAVPVGMSLCATDSGSVVLAYVSGELNDLSGAEASDALVELVLSQSQVPKATPVAS